MNDMMTDGKFYCLLGCGVRTSEPMVCDACFKASNPQLTSERREKSKADARALWAVRVLDAKVRQLGGCNVYWSSNDDTCGIRGWEDHEGWHRHGHNEDAARLSAANDLFPGLFESVRRELGECPT